MPNNTIAPESSDTSSRTPDTDDLYARAERFLDSNELEKAFNVFVRAKANSPWVTNGLGVCQLRMGNAHTAVDVFRRLVLAPGGVLLRRDVPVVFKTNYAAALLATDNIAGCMGVLNEIHEENHPAVAKLNSVIADWKNNLTLWERLYTYIGGQPERPARIDFPLGDLQ